ncbi:MAG TPA: HEAT repeat domain-containing protein, partial [Planctomycetaceae bacterium]|nr:HEAT repeat domain-containing protein [Planctomycetaceae bacterium]
KTASAVVIEETPRATSRPLVALLVLALAAVAWLIALRIDQARLNRRTERLMIDAFGDTSQPQVIRVFAAKTLGDLGPDASDAVKNLLDAFTDPDILVRSEAARAIGRIGGDGYLQATLKNIHDKDESPIVRDALSEAIKELARSPSKAMWPYVVAALLVVLGCVGYWMWRQATAA